MRLTLPCLVGCLLLAACDKDETILPPYVTDLAEVHTDGTGCAGQMLFDDGSEVLTDRTITGLEADSTYRIIARYTRLTTDRIHLTDYATVLAPWVLRYEPNHVICDPVNVVACWRAGGYINLKLSVRTANSKAHYFGFCREAEESGEAGETIHNIRLLHSRNQDPEYFTRETYLSLPLRAVDPRYADGQGNTLRLHIQTFEGEKLFTFRL